MVYPGRGSRTSTEPAKGGGEWGSWQCLGPLAKENSRGKKKKKKVLRRRGKFRR